MVKMLHLLSKKPSVTASLDRYEVILSPHPIALHALVAIRDFVCSQFYINLHRGVSRGCPMSYGDHNGLAVV